MESAAVIRENIARKKAELAEEEARLLEAELVPEDKQFAEELHAKMCRWNHTDGCGWFWVNDWNDRTHKEWLDKARRLLEISDRETILKILNIAK